MKIKSKLTGEVSNVRADIAREMVKLGVAEAIGESPNETASRLPQYGDAVIHRPQWSVEAIGEENKTLAIVMRLGENQVVSYVGHPKHVNARREWPGGGRWLSGFGRECPSEIVKQYARQWNANENLRAPLSVPGPHEANVKMAAEKEFYNRKVAAGDASPGLK